jgi:3-phosphoinositide dependent protein kinase-1
LHIKVTDFGSAKIMQDNENNNNGDDTSAASTAAARSFVGTAEYVSPELLRSEVVSKEADLWAFGCVIYQMLSGKSPFKAPTDYLIFQKIKNLEYTMPEEFPEIGKDIVHKLLSLDPEKRLGSQATGGIQAIKDHPFFEGVDWDNIFNSTAPPLKERLEEEAKKNPTVPPTFDFGQEDDEDDEDMWLDNGHPAHKNPFNDQQPMANGDHTELLHQGDHISPITSSSKQLDEPLHISPSTTPDTNNASNRSSFINRDSALQHQRESMKIISQMSSVASSVQSVPERLGSQSHPPW